MEDTFEAPLPRLTKQVGSVCQSWRFDVVVLCTLIRGESLALNPTFLNIEPDGSARQEKKSVS